MDDIMRVDVVKRGAYARDVEGDVTLLEHDFLAKIIS
jgi:hypothetical protein